MIGDARAFILENTRLLPVSHAPEIRLRLADEVTPLWRLTEERLGELGVAPPFWAFAWAGGQGLARYVLDHPEVVAGRRVLDFATGSGLVAVAAMRAGAASALACDLDPLSAAAVRLNAEANGVEVAFTGADLLAAPAPAGAEVILAGDICYERPLAERVERWLHEAQARGATVLLGDPGRTYLPRERLRRLAEYQVSTTRELEDQAVKRTAVYALA